MGRPPMPDEEEPRREPEIIPPDRRRGRSARDRSGIWASIDGGSARRSSSRIYLVRPGPLAMLLAVLALAALAALTLVVLIGVFLVWVPALVLLAAAIMLSGLVRGRFRRPR